MCGIAGFLNFKDITNSDAKFIVNKMGQSIFHRGPDDSGNWCSSEHQIAMVHRRLSIIDLTKSGKQPMHSKCGNNIIIFNGEIYNHLKLRKELTNVKWNGGSDTETLLEAITQWGIDITLSKIVGMYAFALYNMHTRELYLCRDRVGEKPLYYGVHNNVLIFGSELKAIRLHPNFIDELDLNSLALHLQLSYVPSPYSIYKNTKKLNSGKYLICKLSSNKIKISEKTYWDLESIALKGKDNRHADYELAKHQVNNLIETSVIGQMNSDVPIGAFLSGGIDSSLICAIMNKNAHKSIKTFSIGIKDKQYDEAIYSKEIAKYINSDHNEIYVDDELALNVVPQLTRIFDEPFSDSSQIPTYLVSKIAKNDVTVALSGDGLDELFGGYNRHFKTEGIVKKLRHMPIIFRKLLGKLLGSIKPQHINFFVQIVNILTLNRNIFSYPADKVNTLIRILNSNDINLIYQTLVVKNNINLQLVNGVNYNEVNNIIFNKTRFNKNLSFSDNMMLLDTINYLSDDILFKVDRASMANSLETRVPYLDHHLIEMAWRIPNSMKIRNGEGKYIVKDILYQHIPKKLFNRPKMGFSVPLATWLRGPLKEWADSLLNYDKIKYNGILNADIVSNMWQEHLSGNKNYHFQLWDILIFQDWWNEQKT